MNTYNTLSPHTRAALAFEAHTLNDQVTAQLINASFTDKDATWHVYADRLANLNILFISLVGMYWKFAAKHDFRSAWLTQETIKIICNHAGINAALVFEVNEIELLPEPKQYNAQVLNELKREFIALL